MVSPETDGHVVVGHLLELLQQSESMQFSETNFVLSQDNVAKCLLSSEKKERKEGAKKKVLPTNLLIVLGLCTEQK